MIRHISFGEETEGEHKGMPFIKITCDAETLQVLMTTFGQVMQMSSMAANINSAISRGMEAVKKKAKGS